MKEIDCKGEMKKSLIWVDAHGYGFDWPLKEEVDYFTTNFSDSYIFIDDFKVPGKEMFKWDSYNEQECNYDYIKNNIKNNLNVYYPAYEDHTSKIHPLTGWCLLSKEDEAIKAMLKAGLIFRGQND